MFLKLLAKCQTFKARIKKDQRKFRILEKLFLNSEGISEKAKKFIPEDLKKFNKNPIDIAQEIFKKALQKPLIKKSTIQKNMKEDNYNRILNSFGESDNSELHKNRSPKKKREIFINNLESRSQDFNSSSSFEISISQLEKALTINIFDEEINLDLDILSPK